MMRLLRTTTGKRSSTRLTALIITVLQFLSAPLAADTTCGIEMNTAPEGLVLAINSMKSGDYVAFVGALEPEGKSPPEDSMKLASDLEGYSSEGFDECVVAREDIRPNSQSLFVVFKAGDQDNQRVVFVFFMLAKIGTSWQFLKTQVSTNFDEVYQFVR